MDPSRSPLLSSPLVARAARWGIVAWTGIGLAILAFLIYRYVLFPIRIIFPPLVVALLIVYLLNPLISRLERRGIPRVWGTLLTYVVFLSLAGLALSYLIPLVSDQVTGFVRSVPGLIARAESGIENLADRLGISLRAEDVFSTIQQNRETALSFLGRITSFTVGVLHVALIFVLGAIIGFYLLVDLPKLRQALQAVIPARRRPEVEGVGEKLGAALGGFFRGQLLVALFVGVASMAGLYIVGLPYWALVGLVAGLFNLVPLIGPFIGAIPAVFIAFTTSAPDAGLLVHPSPGWPLALASAAVLFIVQQVDNHIISPNVVARTVKLHPVTVMLSLLAGGTLLGLWGMLLAVPTVAAAKILLMHYWDTRLRWPPGAPAGPVEPEVAPAPTHVAVGAPGREGRWWSRWRLRRAGRPAEAEAPPEPVASERR